MKESDIQNAIRLALNPYAVIFRNNVGKVKTADGRFFDTGLPKGYSDLSGFRKSDGKMIFIEVKNEKGRLREDQKHFLNTVKQYPVIAGVARSADEAINLVNEVEQW
ncbi:VRR-NUC domain-containing protein [Oceanobacillus sp. FSL W8-0428]